MKRSAALVLGLCLLWLAGCTQTPGPATDPTQPQTKTVYVHTSLTQEFGATVNRTEYLFDAQDHVTEVVVYTNDEQTKRHSVECDENGNYIKWTSDNSVTEYTYDQSGHSLGVSLYINDELVSSTAYTWEGDLRTSVTTQMVTQGMTQRLLMTYDSSGRLLRQDTYSADTLSSYAIYTTGEDDRIAAMTVYQPDGTLLYTNTYTWEGTTQTVMSTLPDGTVNQTAVLTHDEHGNLLTQVIYDSKNELISKETHTWKAVTIPIDCPRASV